MQEFQSRMQNALRRLGKATVLLPVFLLFLLGFLSLARGQSMTLQAAGEAEIRSLVDAANDVLLPIILDGYDSGRGIVYRDYNADGARDPDNEPGVPGITVSAYTADGSKAADAVTDAQGRYNLVVPGGVQYRLEVTGIPDYLQPGVVGINSEATVAFANAPINNVNFGLNNPADYCQDNPELGTPCYVFGDQSQDLPVLVSFHNRAGSTATEPPDNYDPDKGPVPYDDANNDVPGVQAHPIEAVARDIGATNGLAFQRSENVLFAGAFMKRHSGFGPGGTGAIYRIDRANNNSVSVYADLNALFGPNTAGANPHDSSQSTTNPLDFFLHDPSFDQVGKISLGDMEISEDEKYLYTVNLADKILYRIPVVNAASPGFSQADIAQFKLPAPSNCAATDVRPFALAVQDGTLYAGMVCTAQSTQNRKDMRAIVYSFDGKSFSGPVIDFRLDYPRRCADNLSPGSPTCGIPQDYQGNKEADWKPWVGTFGDLLEKSGSVKESTSIKRRITNYPQPLLTDIEFAKGYMILGLRDRNGDLFGNGAHDPRRDGKDGEEVGFLPDMSAPDILYRTISAGDILAAAPASNGWVLENNAVLGSLSPTAGAGNGNGPGDGEYFFDESFEVVVDNFPRHSEIAQGGLTNIPGQGDALTTSFNPIPKDDPLNYFDGGIIWLSGQDGSRSRSYRVFAGEHPSSSTPGDPSALLQGKNNGLGDLEVFCDQAPLEIGDRVWLDTNKDGIQDPGEPPLPGVNVRLYAPDMTLLAEAKTNADGNYYFSNATSGPLSGLSAVYNVEGLKPNTTGYKLRIDMNQAVIAAGNMQLTKANADGHTDNNNKLDLRDSDATLSGTDAEITFDTGGAGHNNHTLDFGFIGDVIPPDIYITKKTNGQDADQPVEPDVPQIRPGDPVTWTYEVTNTGGIPFAKEDVVVTDSRGVIPVFSRVLIGDADDILEPLEVWEYKASGIAENVGLPIPEDGVPTLWGINEDVNGLFSINAYPEIGLGSAAAEYTNHGRLYYNLDGVNTLIPRDIGSIAISFRNIAYVAYNKDLDPGGGQPNLTAPVLLSLDLDNLPGTGVNVVTVIGSIPIPGFDTGAAVDDNISGMSFDPRDPEDGLLYALYRVTDGPTTDKLVAISRNDAIVVGEIGEMKNDALGLYVEDGEALEFDEFGNMYVSDNWDDHLYKVNPETAEIIELVDNDEKGGLNVNSLKTEGLAWDPIKHTMVASDDNHDLFYIQTLEDGNNASLGSLPELTDVEAIDFIISTCYMNLGTVTATVTSAGVSHTVSYSDPSHYCN